MADERKLSDAGKMAECLADLVCHREPRWPRSVWLEFVTTTIGTEPSSPNRQEGANACEMFWQLARGNFALVRQILDFERWYHSERPFMANEPMTKEPVYRVLHAYPPGQFAAVARDLDHPAAEPCAASARSHAAWLTLGRATAPGRKLVDHKRGARDGCVLVFTKKPKARPVYVAQAGQRSFIRSGKTAMGDVEFVDAITCPIIVQQALGMDYPKKGEPVQRDLYEGHRRRWPLAHPWALAQDDVMWLRDLAANPTSVAAAEHAVAMLRAPGVPYRIDRYTRGSVVTLLEQEHNSSTDEVTIDAAFAGAGGSCEVQWATCSDGVRSTQEDQVGYEEVSSYACRLASGAGPVHRVPKPADEHEVYSVRAEPGRGCWIETTAGQRDVPATPPGRTPEPPRERPERWWEVS